jgi:hypothetical protein
LKRLRIVINSLLKELNEEELIKDGRAFKSGKIKLGKALYAYNSNNRKEDLNVIAFNKNNL